MAARWAGRSEAGRALIDRLGTVPDRNPLVLAAVPIGLSLTIVVPMMLSTIFGATLGDGQDGILGYAVEEWPGSSVFARTDVAQHTFVVAGEGVSGAQRLRLFEFKRVFPGRFTWVGTGEMAAGGGSRFGWSITVYNTLQEEIPTVVVWGWNDDDATPLRVSGNGADETMTMPSGHAFVVGFPYDIEAHLPERGILEDFRFTFMNGSGDDVTARFESEGR